MYLFIIFGVLNGFGGHPLSLDSALTASEAIREYSSDCARAGSNLWGRSLCGPLLIVDTQTRTAIANEPDSAGMLARQPDGTWLATLRSSVQNANTTVTWGGRDWAMVILPLPVDRISRLRLLAHESFHREQKALGFATRDPVSPHLDELEGRLSLRLEMRAWAAALVASRDRQKDRVRDALAFRAERYKKFAAADSLESTMELHEGLAEYTGTRVAIDVAGATLSRISQDLERKETQESFVRSFAYATGPALGLMLDRFSPGWRQNANVTPSLAHSLAAAIGFDWKTVSRASATARGARYHYADVRRSEENREAARRARIAEYRRLFVEQPVLILRQQNIGMSFNPGNLVPLGANGTVYPTGSFTGPWGKIMITDRGALLSPDFRELRVPAPTNLSGPQIKGPGWVLDLADGWQLTPSRRTGDIEANIRK